MAFGIAATSPARDADGAETAATYSTDLQPFIFALFFAAYFIVSIPAASLVRRIGYMRSAVVGLLTRLRDTCCSCWRRSIPPRCRAQP